MNFEIDTCKELEKQLDQVANERQLYAKVQQIKDQFKDEVEAYQENLVSKSVYCEVLLSVEKKNLGKRSGELE